MPKSIDWMYDRKNCTTCKKSRGYLETCGTKVKTSEDATKVRYGPAEALTLLAGIDTLIAVKGKKVVTIDLKKARPDDETILAHIIGPSGNLRAPTAKVGKTMLVGFTEEGYAALLG